MNRHFRGDEDGGVKIEYRDSLGRVRKWTAKTDREWDRKNGIKEGSAEDNRLDRERGVPVRKRK